MTKIKYHKRKQRFNLINGTLWCILGVISIFFTQSNHFLYGYLIIGVLFFSIYYYQRYYQYITITKNSIIKHSFPDKEITISEISEVRDFAGDFKLISDSKTIYIQKDLIEPSSLKVLEHTLNSLNIST